MTRPEMPSFRSSPLVLVLLASLPLVPSFLGAIEVERVGVLMGTRATVAVMAADRPSALARTELVFRALEAGERRLSTWESSSELLRLEAALGSTPVVVEETLDHELQAALACAEVTDGAFDPTIGSLVDAWDLRGRGVEPSTDELAAALRSTGWGFLRREPTGWTTSRAGLRFEEGGFGKGAALDRALEALATEAGAEIVARLDLGGQLAVRGASVEVDLVDPDRRDRPVARVLVEHGSIATTGNSERARAVQNRRIGHVLDPRTGRPAADFGSLTVLAPEAIWADCLSTGLFVLGPDAALQRAEQLPDVEIVVLERTDAAPRVRWSSGLAGRVELLAPSAGPTVSSAGATAENRLFVTRSDGAVTVPGVDARSMTTGLLQLREVGNDYRTTRFRGVIR